MYIRRVVNAYTEVGYEYMAVGYLSPLQKETGAEEWNFKGLERWYGAETEV
jgi:hypothetical protein